MQATRTGDVHRAMIAQYAVTAQQLARISQRFLSPGRFPVFSYI